MLIAALVLAVASVGTVGFFADRVKGALTRQANLLLGADLLISGDRPLPDSFAREARRAGSPRYRRSSSTAWCKRPEAPRRGAVLADVKAVAAGYPLRGAIMLVDPANAGGQRRAGHPAAAAKSGSTRGSRRGSACSKARGSPSAKRR